MRPQKEAPALGLAPRPPPPPSLPTVPAHPVSSLQYHNATYSVGDNVLIQPSSSSPPTPPHVARITHISGDLLTVTWYYRPEEIYGGRKCYHGQHEILLTDHASLTHISSTLGIARVVALADYVALVGDGGNEISTVSTNNARSGSTAFTSPPPPPSTSTSDPALPVPTSPMRPVQSTPKKGSTRNSKSKTSTDSLYFCRTMYACQTGLFTPPGVEVHCICTMPFNPDLPMLPCSMCREWYHVECLGRESRDKRNDPTWVCPQCDGTYRD